jgi:hypothetical protein
MEAPRSRHGRHGGAHPPPPDSGGGPFPPECAVCGTPLVFTATMTCRAGHVHRARTVYVWCPRCKG